jgi:hypothetical protein
VGGAGSETGIMKLRVLIGLGAVLSVCGSALAEEGAGHVLAREGLLPAAGKTFTQRTVSETGEAVLKYKLDFQTAKGTIWRKEAANEVVEGLGEGKARRVLMSKTVEKRTVIQEMEQPEEEEHHELQGLPVIVEFKEGKWAAALEEGEATPEQKAELDEYLGTLRAETDVATYGKEPRKPGDSWKVDPKSLKEFCGAQALEGDFSVEFVEVKEIGGTPCAVLKSVFDLKGLSPKEEDEPQLKMTLKGESVVHRSLADLVDVEAKLSGTILAEGAPGGGVTFSIEGPIKGEGTTVVGKE